MVMRKFFTALVVIPLGIFFVIFAVANRHLVTVSFDPFNSVTPTVAITLPLFVVIIAVAMLGVLAGGMATWFRQGRFRRAARHPIWVTASAMPSATDKVTFCVNR